jgi:isopentenyl-diphosphate delta-isomerase
LQSSKEGKYTSAGSRRLFEEMGFKTELKELFILFIAPFDNGLTEHEFDHVMIGYYDENPVINQKKLKLGNGWLLMT